MLHVENLTYQYGTLVVLRDLSLHLAPGQVGLLFGENGAGKSTLLRCVAGWTEPRKGSLAVDGATLRGEDREYRARVAFVPDTPDFYDELTAWEHLHLVGQLHRLPDWQDRATHLLERFRLLEHQGALPFTFSRGMRAKLALCMALLISPPLLLLDEPFNALDALARQTLWQALRAHAEQGGAVLFSSHSIASGVEPDVLLHLRDGQIEPVEPPDSLDLTGLLAQN